jgi:dihydroorotate dehydrogenase electron transfer subunit
LDNVATPRKGSFVADVLDNVALNPSHYRLILSLKDKAALAFSRVVPGQFAQFNAADLALPLPQNIPPHLRESASKSIMLRRPLSFANLTSLPSGEVILEVLFCVLGPATLRMTTLAKGDKLSIIGPLGKGYSVPDGKRLALLVAGGMGAPPLQHMGAWLRTNMPKMDIMAFAGARTLAQLPFKVDPAKVSPEPSMAIAEFAEHGIKSLIATDDGSSGHRGFVTELLSQWLSASKVSHSEMIIYTCGPEVMMKAVSAIAAEHNIDCQVSMERMMACGIGLCQSCAVECTTGQSDTVYRLCCKDGPVFDSREIVW